MKKTRKKACQPLDFSVGTLFVTLKESCDASLLFFRLFLCLLDARFHQGRGRFGDSGSPADGEAKLRPKTMKPERTNAITIYWMRPVRRKRRDISVSEAHCATIVVSRGRNTPLMAVEKVMYSKLS